MRSILKNFLLIFIISLYSPLTKSEELLIDFNTTEDPDSHDIFSKIEDTTFINITHNKELEQLTEYPMGKIIALNKITATPREISLITGESKYFGNIKIKLHKCIKNLDPYNEDNYILLTITEYMVDEDPTILFQGWMMSSSLSISTFEHPIYEIFAKDCGDTNSR